jgi:hypothetical protein
MNTAGSGVGAGGTGTVSLTVCGGVGATGAVLVGKADAGVGAGGTGTVSLTVCGGVGATGAVLVDTGLVHPLMKTIPITRTVKIQIAFHFFIAHTPGYRILSILHQIPIYDEKTQQK